MSFIWPELLWLLLALPALVAAYLLVLRRKNRRGPVFLFFVLRRACGGSLNRSGNIKSIFGDQQQHGCGNMMNIRRRPISFE